MATQAQDPRMLRPLLRTITDQPTSAGLGLGARSTMPMGRQVAAPAPAAAVPSTTATPPTDPRANRNGWPFGPHQNGGLGQHPGPGAGGTTTPTPAPTPTPSGTLPTPAPSASASLGPVAQGVSDLIGQDSPLMQRAYSQGVETANRRGLGNSSLAGEAGQAAVLDAAVPIASQEASINEQTDLAKMEDTRARDLSTQQITSNEKLAGQDIASREQMQSQQIASQEKISTQQIAAQTQQVQAQLAEHQQEALASTIAQVDSTRLSALSNTLVNPDIPANVRAQIQQSINDQASQTVNYLQNIYGVSVSGATPTTAPVSYAPTSPYADYQAATMYAANYNGGVPTAAAA